MCKTAFLALAVLLAPLLFAQDLKTVQPQGYVSDFAGVLDPNARAQLEDYCARVEQATGVQMALVTVKTLNDEPIENAANSLFRRWGIGQKGKDEGLLLMLDINEHKDRIEVGYGLEPILPDGFVGGILRTVKPYLEQNNYSQAMLAAAEEMGSRIAQSKGVTLDFSLHRRPVRVARSRGSGIPWTLVIIGLVFLFSILGRGGRGGGGGGFLAGMLLGNILGGRSGGWGGGGGFGGYDSGGGGGGGGFGGFGGGDSGGGGASGSW
jgi:uncharacterized protein